MLEGYIGKIRSKIGSQLFIYPAARIIIENEVGEFLFFERVDNGNLGLPAGGLEENETIKECIIREVKEETGLTINDAEVIGISSDPELEKVQYPNGDQTQYFTIEFYTNKYEGELRADGIESKSVAFKPKYFIKYLLKNEILTFDSLKFYRKNGKINIR